MSPFEDFISQSNKDHNKGTPSIVVVRQIKYKATRSLIHFAKKWSNIQQSGNKRTQTELAVFTS